MCKKYIPLFSVLMLQASIVNAYWFPFLNNGVSDQTSSYVSPEISAQHKMMRDMNFEELEYTKNKHIKNNNYDVALKYLEKMISLCENLEAESRVRLELADLLFTCEKYRDAGLQYNQFYQLYRNDTNAEYALYRSVNCCLKQLCEPSRDQSKTVEAIELADEFLGVQTFTTYTEDVKKIRKQCQGELLKAGISVFRDYVCRKHFKSAYQRLTTIKENFSQEFEHLDQIIAQLEQEWSDAAGVQFPRKEEKQIEVAAVNLAEVSQAIDKEIEQESTVLADAA